MKIISLFSCAGLFDAGLINAGNKLLLQFEKGQVQLEILKNTFPNIIKHNDTFKGGFRLLWNRPQKLRLRRRCALSKCLEIIGNGIVYDVWLFIGKSLKMFNDYFYDNPEGHQLKKVPYNPY